MKRVISLTITGVLLMACSLGTSILSVSTPTPEILSTNTPQTDPTELPSATASVGEVNLSFPNVSDKKISEYPNEVVLLKSVQFYEQSGEDFEVLNNILDFGTIHFNSKTAAGFRNGKVEIWGFEDGKLYLKQSYDTQQERYYRLRFSHSGNKLLMRNNDVTPIFYIWDTNSWQLTEIHVDGSDAFFGEAYEISPNGQQFVWLARKGNTGSIEFRDTSTGQVLYTYDLPGKFDWTDFNVSVGLAYSSDSKKLAVGISQEMKILLLDTDTGKLSDSWSLNSEAGAFHVMLFCSMDEGLALEISNLPEPGGAWESRFETFDIPTHSTLYGIHEEHNFTNTLSPVCSQDGKQLIIDNKNKLSLLDFGTGRVQNTVDQAGSYAIKDVQYHLDDRLLILVTEGNIQFWGIP